MIKRGQITVFVIIGVLILTIVFLGLFMINQTEETKIDTATQKILMQAQHEGLMDILIEAGAVVSNPTCGACLGGYMGILGDGERCVATTNRNFVGRMGARTSEIYLANSAVAAASAIAGKIVDPRDI